MNIFFNYNTTFLNRVICFFFTGSWSQLASQAGYDILIDQSQLILNLTGLNSCLCVDDPPTF